jgi:hypothetical protein
LESERWLRDAELALLNLLAREPLPAPDGAAAAPQLRSLQALSVAQRR